MMKKRLPENGVAFLVKNGLVQLTPSYHGTDCIANYDGKRKGCSECHYLAVCFPEYDDPARISH